MVSSLSDTHSLNAAGAQLNIFILSWSTPTTAGKDEKLNLKIVLLVVSATSHMIETHVLLSIITIYHCFLLLWFLFCLFLNFLSQHRYCKFYLKIWEEGGNLEMWFARLVFLKCIFVYYHDIFLLTVIDHFSLKVKLCLISTVLCTVKIRHNW